VSEATDAPFMKSSILVLAVKTPVIIYQLPPENVSADIRYDSGVPPEPLETSNSKFPEPEFHSNKISLFSEAETHFVTKSVVAAKSDVGFIQKFIEKLPDGFNEAVSAT
jgi:hypothetical protein